MIPDYEHLPGPGYEITGGPKPKLVCSNCGARLALRSNWVTFPGGVNVLRCVKTECIAQFERQLKYNNAKRPLTQAEMMEAFNLLRSALASEIAWRGRPTMLQWARSAEEYFERMNNR